MTHLDFFRQNIIYFIYNHLILSENLLLIYNKILFWNLTKIHFYYFQLILTLWRFHNIILIFFYNKMN